MNIQYYIKPFSFRLPIYMVGCLLLACSKLDSRYHIKRKASILNVEASLSKCSKDDITLSLFEAIKASKRDKVEKLLQDDFFKGVGIVKLCKTDSRGNTYLHIAAGINKGNQDAEAAIMNLLLDKMRFLFLCENSYLEITRIYPHKSDDALQGDIYICPSRLERFIENSKFWTIDNIPMQKNQKDIFDRLRPNPLLINNNDGETPLMVAMKQGNLQVLEHLLKYTHSCVGINLDKHKDSKKDDFFDVVLQQKDASKLACLMQELCKCNCRNSNSLIHFSHSKCRSEYVIQSIFTSKLGIANFK